MKIYCNVCNKYKKSKKGKYYIFKKTLHLSVVYSERDHKYKKYLKKKNQLKS